MRVKTTVIASLLIAMLVLVGCGDGDSNAKESATEPASASSADTESLDTQLQQQYGDTDWFARIDHIATVMKLRHPVIEIHFMDSVGEVRGSYMSDVQAAVSSIMENSYYLEVYGTDGVAGGSGSGSGESVQLPPMPASIDDLASWMDQAYGPASGDTVEDWYGHITGYDLELDAWDGERVIVVKTDLVVEGYEWSPERAIADLAGHAVKSAEIDWATDLRIEDASGENLSSGDYRSDMIPYRGY